MKSRIRNSKKTRVDVIFPISLLVGLQIVIASIAKAMIPLSNVCVLVAFVIVIYAIIGLQMLIGSFHFTCFNTTTNGETPC